MDDNFLDHTMSLKLHWRISDTMSYLTYQTGEGQTGKEVDY